MRKLAALWIGVFLLCLLPAAEGGIDVPILLYHRFGPSVADSMTVTTPVFESHLKYLKDNGINVFYDEFEQVSLWGRNLVDHLGKVYEKQSQFIVMFIYAR